MARSGEPTLSKVYPPLNVETSIPTVEELRTEVAIASSNPHSGKNLRLYFYAGVCLLIVSVIVGTSVGLVKKKGTSAAPPSINDKDAGVIAGGPSKVSRADAVHDFLSKEISDFDDLQLDGSPQMKASTWIADFDSRQVAIPTSTDYDNSYEFVQRYILAVLYFGLGGESWSLKLGFLSEASECEWNEEIKSNNPFPNEAEEWLMGAKCDELGHVSSIFMPSNKLVGTLPPEFGYLQALRHVSFFDNQLYGPFPHSMRSLTNMNFFAMENNFLSGPIPDFFNEYKSLSYLALGKNQLTGELPSFSKLDQLEHIDLQWNYLSGSIDGKLSGATSLEQVYLQHNGLSGTIDDGLFADTEFLSLLDMSNNFFSGYFPQHFYEIEIVDLHNNSISTELPPVAKDDYAIKFLSLYNNGFTGPIPNDVGILSKLVHLDLSGNKLNGGIPGSLNDLNKLEYLSLSGNEFDDGIIPNLSSLHSLRELSLKRCNRIGAIPDWLGNLTALELLDLDDNYLDGEVPDIFQDMVNLQFLLLNRNELTGEIPDSFGDLTSLTLLLLDKNDFVGDDSAFCNDDGGPAGLSLVIADCEPEFTCNCCTKCCNDDDQKCNNEDLQANLDDSYERIEYVFGDGAVYEAHTNNDTVVVP